MRIKIVSTVSFLVLLFSLLFVSCFQALTEAVGEYSVDEIERKAEYVNGTILGGTIDMWYAWVNVSETQVLYYALHSDQVNSPMINFLGQRFQVKNETEVFVGNTLTLIEVYNDTDGDGIPQADFISGESEIAYYLLVNSSVSYEATPIQKSLQNDIPHYTWGFKYYTIDGFLLYPEEQPGPGAAEVIIDHLGFNYDFYVTENVSYMKTSFDIGEITEVEPLGVGTEVSLEGLSLSLLFGTVTMSAKPYTPYVNGESYNSTTTPYPATATSSGQIAVETIKAYEVLFAETYNLTREETVESHEVKAEAAATTSVPPRAESRLNWLFTHFEHDLNISDLFPSAHGLKGEVNLDWNASAFLYRICYPVWDGLNIHHDPTYIAYLFSNIIIPEFPPSLIPLLFAIATIVAVIVHRTKHRP